MAHQPKRFKEEQAEKDYFFGIGSRHGLKRLARGETGWKGWRLLKVMPRLPPWMCGTEEIILYLEDCPPLIFILTCVCCLATPQQEFLDRNQGLLYEIKEEHSPYLI